MSDDVRKVLTDEEADWEVLRIADENGKFALPLGEELPTEIQAAFDGGLDRDWFRLFDVRPVQTLRTRFDPGGRIKLMRVFKLTDAGMTMRHAFKLKYEADANG